MKQTAPTPAQFHSVQSAIQEICPDRVNCRLVTLLAFAEHFERHGELDVVAFHAIAPHGGVFRALRMARIATGQSGNAIASDGAVRALDAARRHIAVMFGEAME